MEWYEIVLIIVIALFVVGVFANRIRRRMKGENTCDCCSCKNDSCSMCSKKGK